MACFNRFLPVSGLLSVVALALLATLFCCTSCNKKELPNNETPEEGRYLVDAEIVEVDKQGVVLSKTSLRSDASSLRASHPTYVETAKGKITGLGFFNANASTVISVFAKSGYKYKGMYFRFTSGYNKSTYPTDSSHLLSPNVKTVTVAGNLTVIAVFEKDDGVEVVIE